jgi:hypothetical protein
MCVGVCVIFVYGCLCIRPWFVFECQVKRMEDLGLGGGGGWRYRGVVGGTVTSEQLHVFTVSGNHYLGYTV